MQLPMLLRRARAALAGTALLCAAAPAFAQVSAGGATIIAFDDMPVGSPPAGFATALTGRGDPPVWIVESVDGAGQVLAQMSADPTSFRFPLCVLNDFVAADVDVSIRFQPLSGETDQAAGLVWRYADPDNYYVVRANALENNVVLYKMENGRRRALRPVGASLLAYGEDAPVPAGEWSTLRVVARGTRFSVSLNDEHLYDVEDGTFEGAGRVGLWTKADSVTRFDDFAYGPASEE